MDSDFPCGGSVVTEDGNKQESKLYLIRKINLGKKTELKTKSLKNKPREPVGSTYYGRQFCSRDFSLATGKEWLPSVYRMEG